MNYGNPKVLGGGTLATTGLALSGQISIVIAAIILVLVAALTIRHYWRRDKGIDE